MSQSTRQRRRLRLALFVAGPLALLLYGAYYVATTGRYVETTNAYVRFDILPVSANVAGRVAEVAVRQNGRVKKGAVLFRIDDAPYRIRVADATAELEIVRNRIRALVASYRQTTVELLEARERTKFFQHEFERQKRLRGRGVTTATRFEKAQLDLVLAKQRERTLKEKVNVALEQLGGYPSRSPERHAFFLKAKAQLNRTMLDLGYTVVRAPFDGVVSNLRLQVGHYVKPGDKLFSLISTGRVWIEANLKETQLTDIRPGQSATVVADAFPDVVWRAQVESIASATGSEFALLPPQNASGNWVKVVRRLTVRLKIEQPTARLMLRSGMSVHASIDTGRESWLVRWVGALLGDRAPRRTADGHRPGRAPAPTR